MNKLKTTSHRQV